MPAVMPAMRGATVDAVQAARAAAAQARAGARPMVAVHRAATDVRATCRRVRSVAMAVLPIAVTSARCWPRKSLVLQPGVIDVSIGPLIPSTDRRPEDLMREVEAWIEAEMHRLDPDAYPAPVQP